MAREIAKSKKAAERREEPREGDRAPSSLAGLDGYWAASSRPLPVLVFLLPLVLLYELGSVLYLTNPEAGTLTTIDAKKLLQDSFEVLGVAGLYVPGVALVTVLLVWHIMSRDPWRVRASTLLGMLAESIGWTIPLLVLAAVHGRLVAAGELAPLELVQATGSQLMEKSWQARLTISIGAGLYEEMLFRLVGIALLHFIIKDLLGAKEWIACSVAVIVSAIAFAVYHDPRLKSDGPDWYTLAFMAVAGAYFGNVYVMRGFGIVVATHALYDAMVLVALQQGE